MSSAEPSKENTSLSRWHRPRVYVTIVAFIQMALGGIAIVYPYFSFEGFGGFYFVYYAGVLIYLIAASLSAFYLLKSQPRFAFPIVFTLLVTAITSVWTIGNTYDLIRYCTSGSASSCNVASAFTYPMMGFLAFTAVLTLVLLRGWKLYDRQFAAS